jgi:hypothetical protein
MSILVRRAAAAFFVAHGVAHLVGFLGSWGLGEFEDAPYTTFILNGTVDVGDIGMRVVGVLWLAAAAAFGAAAVAVWRGHIRAVAALTTFSLVVCVIGLPTAIVGVWVDVAILLALGAVAVVRPAALRPVPR